MNDIETSSAQPRMQRDMPGRMGNMLVRIGVMTQDQVKEVKCAQRAEDSRLFGDIAIKRLVNYMESTGDCLDA